MEAGCLQGAILHCLELERLRKQRQGNTCGNDTQQNAWNDDPSNNALNSPATNPKDSQSS